MQVRMTFMHVATLTVAEAHAQALQPPIEADLKAAYCFGVTQQTISGMPN